MDSITASVVGGVANCDLEKFVSVDDMELKRWLLLEAHGTIMDHGRSLHAEKCEIESHLERIK